MANPTVVVSQGIEHFRYMTRLRYTTVGGAASETVTVGDITLSPGDYIRVLNDPNVNVTSTRIIEIKASRSQANGTILLGSADGTTNIPAGLSLEILIIRRQTRDGQDASVTNGPIGHGNPADSLFGHLDENGVRSFNPNNGGATDVPVHSLLTADSEVWVDQTNVCASMPSGICEIYSSRTPGTSFRVAQANSGETPGSVLVTFDYAVFNH